MISTISQLFVNNAYADGGSCNARWRISGAVFTVGCSCWQCSILILRRRQKRAKERRP